jgi:hypothetical protein
MFSFRMALIRFINFYKLIIYWLLGNRVSGRIYLLNMQLIHLYMAYFMPGIVKFMLQESFVSWHRF